MGDNGARLEQLREDVKGVRARRGPLPIDRWMLIAGSILIVLGIGLILLGWKGASETPYQFEQTSYLISGGLLGTALAVLGGLMYFGYWMTRQVAETRTQGQEIRDALGRIEVALTSGAGPAVAATSGAIVAARATDGSFVATAKGTMFHVPGCAIVAGRGDTRTVSGTEPGLTPCKICDPLASLATN